MPKISTWANKIRELRTKFDHILTDPFSIRVVEKGGFGGNPNYHQNILRCHVAEAFLFIRHDGYIDFPCKIHPIMSIDALKYPFSQIYNTKEVKEIMKKKDSYDFCDGCRLGCAIAASIPTSWRAVYAKYIKGFINGNLS